MTINNISKKFFILAAIICLAAGAWELSFLTAISAQETQRSRQVAATPTPKTTPKTTPSAAPTVKPAASPTPTATPPIS